MFEDQTVELLPARTTMKALGGGKKPKKSRQGDVQVAVGGRGGNGGDGGNANGGDGIISQPNRSENGNTEGGGAGSITVGALNGNLSGNNVNTGNANGGDGGTGGEGGRGGDGGDARNDD